MSRAAAELRRRDGGGELMRGAARPARRADARRGLGVVSTTSSSKVTAVRRNLFSAAEHVRCISELT
jgi:hypothetical protein